MRGSLQETWDTDPPPSRSLRSRKPILEQEIGAPLPLYLSPEPREALRGVQDATQHCVPSTGRLRHLAPLTAPAPGPKANSGPHIVPSISPALGRVPSQGRKEASQRSSVPTLPARETPRAGALRGAPPPGQLLQRYTGLRGGNTKEPGTNQARSRGCGGGSGSLRRAPTAPIPFP